MKPWTFCACLIILLLWVLPALADEIHLQNGDRLTGEIMKMEEGFLLLKTTYAEEVKLKWEVVVCLTSDKELTFVLRSGEILIGRATCPESGRLQIQGRKVQPGLRV